MAKITVFFFTALFLTFMLSHATRPHPPFHKHLSQETQHVGVEEVHHSEAVDDKCEGVSEEDCLIRRTLVAHLDYIYTQDHKP